MFRVGAFVPLTGGSFPFKSSCGPRGIRPRPSTQAPWKQRKESRHLPRLATAADPTGVRFAQRTGLAHCVIVRSWALISELGQPSDWARPAGLPRRRWVWVRRSGAARMRRDRRFVGIANGLRDAGLLRVLLIRSLNVHPDNLRRLLIRVSGSWPESSNNDQQV